MTVNDGFLPRRPLTEAYDRRPFPAASRQDGMQAPIHSDPMGHPVIPHRVINWISEWTRIMDRLAGPELQGVIAGDVEAGRATR
jgi:hypothetical protein